MFRGLHPKPPFGAGTQIRAPPLQNLGCAPVYIYILYIYIYLYLFIFISVYTYLYLNIAIYV